MKLHKYWADYLDSHPAYAAEIAKQRFGVKFEETPEYPAGAEGSPDIMDRIQEYREIRDAFQEEFGGKSGGFTGLIKDFLHSDKEGELARAFAGLIGAMTQGIQKSQLPPAETVRRIETTRTEESTEEEKQQLSISQYLQRVIAMKPEEAALELTSNLENPEDFRSILFGYAVSMPFNELMDMLAQSCPPFLTPILNRVDKKWLAALYDELNLIKNKKEQVEPQVDETKPQVEPEKPSKLGKKG